MLLFCLSFSHVLCCGTSMNSSADDAVTSTFSTWFLFSIFFFSLYLLFTGDKIKYLWEKMLQGPNFYTSFLSRRGKTSRSGCKKKKKQGQYLRKEYQKDDSLWRTGRESIEDPEEEPLVLPFLFQLTFLVRWVHEDPYESEGDTEGRAWVLGSHLREIKFHDRQSSCSHSSTLFSGAGNERETDSFSFIAVDFAVLNKHNSWFSSDSLERSNCHCFHLTLHFFVILLSSVTGVTSSRRQEQTHVLLCSCLSFYWLFNRQLCSFCCSPWSWEHFLSSCFTRCLLRPILSEDPTSTLLCWRF